MSKYGDENKMIMITPESLMTQYAERMACFSYCCKECMEVAKKFRENNRDEVDSYIKNICDGKYPLHFILGLKHRLTRAHREKQLKMSCQALHNAPPNRT